MQVPWGAGGTCQGRKTFLKWGPPVQGNFELAPPNSVRGYTLARPTWRRMKKGAGMHCARAVHVQILCTCSSFAVPTGQTVGTADAKLAGHMYATTTFFVVTVLLRCRCLLATTRCFCACQDQTSLFERGPPVLGNFELSTPNLLH